MASALAECANGGEAPMNSANEGPPPSLDEARRADQIGNTDASAVSEKKQSRWSIDRGPESLAGSSPSAGSTKTGSRWSPGEPGAGQANGGELAVVVPQQRASRWGPSESSSPTPARASRWSSADQPNELLLRILQNVGGLVRRKTKWSLDPSQEEIVKRGTSLALQKRADQLNGMLEKNELEIAEEGRSPSPEPMYDLAGQRINSREKRARESMEAEWKDAIGECVKLDGRYKPPSSWKPPLFEHKLWIPVKRYPGFNFIGFILGPRGNSRRRMEQESGARIVIRGRGSVKDGRATRLIDHTEEDLHVHIQADTLEKVDKAVEIIEPLLQPGQEVAERQMQRQLRELAEINGLVRANDFGCSICGEKGHRDWQCTEPQQARALAGSGQIVCTICGETSHPTSDCPRKFNLGADVQGQPGRTIEKEYLSFLEELGEGGASVPGLDEARKAAAENAERQFSRPPRPTFRPGLGFPSFGPPRGGFQNGFFPPDGAFRPFFRPPHFMGGPERPPQPHPPSEEEEWLKNYEEEQRKAGVPLPPPQMHPWGGQFPGGPRGPPFQPMFIPGDEFFQPPPGGFPGGGFPQPWMQGPVPWAPAGPPHPGMYPPGEHTYPAQEGWHAPYQPGPEEDSSHYPPGTQEAPPGATGEQPPPPPPEYEARAPPPPTEPPFPGQESSPWLQPPPPGHHEPPPGEWQGSF